MTLVLKSKDDKPTAMRIVLPYVFRHWRNQPWMTLTVGGGMLGATAADLFMPLFSGHLVDAVTAGASDPAARRAAFIAFGAIVGLGLLSMGLRLVGLQAIVPFTLRIMSDVARDTFMRVQRFSTDWHANSFARAMRRRSMIGCRWTFVPANASVWSGARGRARRRLSSWCSDCMTSATAAS